MGSCGGDRDASGGGTGHTNPFLWPPPPPSARPFPPPRPAWGPGTAGSAPAALPGAGGGPASAPPAPTRVRRPPCSALRGASLPSGPAPSLCIF